MHRYFKMLIVPFLALFLAAGAAMGYTINDDYVGATPTNDGWYHEDVIGTPYFDVDKMEVSFGSELEVRIYTNYADNIGTYNTDVGDLFISTNGWTPNGPAPYYDDDDSNGEDWEYVLHIAGSNSIDVYSVIQDNIQLSYADSGFVFRDGQEVGYNPPNGQTKVGSGTWGVNTSDKYIMFSTDYTGFDFGNEVGFHWAATCGNDVIEGAAPVPEPATMLLLGTGLLGLASLGRRKLFKK